MPKKRKRSRLINQEEGLLVRISRNILRFQRVFHAQSPHVFTSSTKLARGKKLPRKTKKTPQIQPAGKPRRFWMLGVASLALFYHAYGVLTGVYQDLTIVTYDQAIIIGVLEALLVPFLSVIFLWKSVVWWHDRPRSLKHVFDDPNILD